MFLQGSQGCKRGLKGKCILLKLNCNFKCVYNLAFLDALRAAATMYMFNEKYWLLKYSANFAICGERTMKDLSVLEVRSLMFKKDEWWGWVGSFFTIIILVTNQPSHLLCVLQAHKTKENSGVLV